MAKGIAVPGFKTLTFTANAKAFTGIRDFSGGVTRSVESIIISNATHDSTGLGGTNPVSEDAYPGELQAGTFTISFLYSPTLLTGLNAELGKDGTVSLGLSGGKTVSMDGFISSIGTPYPLRDAVLIDIEVSHGGAVQIS